MLKFREKYKHLKKTHYQMLEYALEWIFGKKSPKTKIIDGKMYYWFSLQKIANDTYKSYYQVKTALYRLENKDKSVDYGGEEPFVFAKMVYSRTETNKLYIRLNYAKIMDILEDDSANKKLISKIRNKEADMPALIEVEKKNYSDKAKKIICNLLQKNSDIFTTRISKTKTFDNCCGAVQDIFNGNFTNPHFYQISSKLCTNQFDFSGWKEKINSAKNDWTKTKDLIENAVANYRLMFQEQNMPSNKKYLPNKLDKWFYDGLNDKGYPSYFVLSLKKPKAQRTQYGENEAKKIFDELPTQIQEIGKKIIKDYSVKSNYALWRNLKGMYGWSEWLLDSDINQNVGYWVASPSEIISGFVDYCESNNILMTEQTFNVQNSLNNNAPFAWFISKAINDHKLNKEILKSCA